MDRNWSYFWGDFDIKDQEQIPQDIMARIEASPWKPLQGIDGLAQPPGRNGRHLLWLKVDLPQRELRDPVLFADFFSMPVRSIKETDGFIRTTGSAIRGQGDSTESRRSLSRCWRIA